MSSEYTSDTWMDVDRRGWMDDSGPGRDFDAEEERIQDEYSRPQMVVREVV